MATVDMVLLVVIWGEVAVIWAEVVVIWEEVVVLLVVTWEEEAFVVVDQVRVGDLVLAEAVEVEVVLVPDMVAVAM